ncbi:Fungal Zn(2)-Cys(6) binuclear cluster domain-containing protein [Penicillium ucsense]|uniref:Fungal Zn(2)-Cys(6) binuclear cluster domain-containing protein n=1 Tax=Penicillium ucsense TaxID=2839758 RepID=A0A8J8W818_9EURO|nr:Fungal Zn(2)-Cys(6) binuclear cluster domain-containing protein [Penicillium ucsense]KAF7737177.1 Fungal Zn(2)-Cys(6) binuclear cluster domain-containing protein [Penicillium ucsense]
MTERVRRNGQLSACEPCRKSKLRCDHHRPVCGRCAQRRLTEQQCLYHPAPMAKPPTPQSLRETIHVQETSVSTRPSPGPYELVNVNSNLMCFVDPNVSRPNRACTSLTRTGVALGEPTLPDQDRICQGAKTLSGIKQLSSEIGETLDSFFASDQDLCLHSPLIKMAWDATNRSIRDMEGTMSSAVLEDKSRMIFEQTSSRLVFPPDPADLPSELSKQSLRWDLLGIHCAQFGIFLGGEKDKLGNISAHQPWKTDRRTLMCRAFEACLQCESFCDSVGAINDLTLWFRSLTILFATWCFGDDSYHVLRLLGSMSSVFFALGFHKGANADPSTPYYMVETRKRAIAWAHDHDKVWATFTSRPAHISRHFCTLELPLELPDSVIMGPRDVFLQAREQLDTDGWNKDGVFHPVSRQRVLLLLSVPREEALELKIGPTTHDLEARAERTLKGLQCTWRSIPSHVKYTDVRETTSDLQRIMCLRYLWLEYLFTQFVLYTILANYSQDKREQLMIIAHEIVITVLLPARTRDALHSYRADIEWALVFYGMPCASVLVLELLRQDQQVTNSYNINRSKVIQDISVLITCCDSWTEPGQSNYQTCRQAQAIFSKSLDSILNRSQSVHRVLAEESNTHDAVEYHDSSGFTSLDSGHDAEWTAWLDSLGLQGDLWQLPSVSTPELFS